MSPEQVTEPVTGSLDDELDQFAAVFTILGSLHYQVPDADHLHELLQMIDEWPLSRPRSPSRMEEGLQMWRLSREEAESRQVVVAAHDRLYGDSAVALVPPYESVHRNREGLVFDEHTLQVRAAYARLGLAAPHLHREPDDHIGLELEFLAQGCLRVLDAREDGHADESHQTLAIVANFLRTHVLAWAPSFLSRVSEQAQTSFMKGVALVTIATLDEFDRCLDSVT